MTASAFQYVFDNAETISIDRQPVAAQTISRNMTVRTVTRAVAKKTFVVKLPDGMPYNIAKPYITAMDNAGKYTEGTITISPSTYGTWFEATDTTTYTIICIAYPQWTVSARNQVSWSGAFTFVEY